MTTYIVYLLKLSSKRDVALMVVKSEVTVLDRNPVNYSDITISPWLPRKGLVVVMVTALTSRGNQHLGGTPLNS